MQGKNFYTEWAKCNIFNYRKFDCFLYCAFYVAIPIVITVVSLIFLSEDGLDIVYFYGSIAVSALNCFYDATGRWNYGLKSLNNTKLASIILSTLLIFSYCLFEIVAILIGKEQAYSFRFDWLLLFYLIVVVVAIIESFLCVSRDIIIRKVDF